MTNERAVEILNLDLDILGQYGGETAEAYKMAIKALEQQPTDAVSREAVIRLVEQYPNIIGNRCSGLISDIKHLPSVIPQTVTEFADKCKECGKIQNEFFNFDAPMVKNSEAVSREAVIKNIKGWFDKIELNPDILIDSIVTLPSVTPKYTDEEIDKAQAVEQAYVDKMVELAVEETKRPKGKWMECGGDEPWLKGYCCSLCNFTTTQKYDYCTCGAEMGGGEDEET